MEAVLSLTPMTRQRQTLTRQALLQVLVLILMPRALQIRNALAVVNGR